MKKGLLLVLVTAICVLGFLSVEKETESATLRPVIVNPGLQKENIVLPNMNKQLLTAPSNLDASSGTPGRVKLTWKDNSINETGFVIERRTGSGAFFPVATEAANATTYQEDELSTYPVFPGEKYYYRVKAVNNSGQSAYSNEDSVVVNNNYSPIPPGNLKAEKHFQSIKLTWDDRSNNETGFEVQRQMEGGQFTTIGRRNPNETSYEDNAVNLPGGVRYTYRIAVLNGAGETAYSNTVSVMVPTHKPSAPRYFSAGPSATSIKLFWNDTSDNEDGFVIIRKKTDLYTHNVEESYPNPEYPDFTLGPNEKEFTDTGLEPDKEYSYMLGAYNLAGWNFDAEATAKTNPKSPILTAEAVSSHEVRLSWVNQSPSNPKGFTLQRKTEGGSYDALTCKYTNDLVFYDKKVSPGKKYYYRVACWNEPLFPSEYSGEVSVTVPNLLVQPGEYSIPPQAPSDVEGEAVSASQINISWKDNSNNETAFRIECRKPGEEFRQVSYTGDTLCPVFNLAADTYYDFRVAAYNEVGQSPYSDVVRVKTLGNFQGSQAVYSGALNHGPEAGKKVISLNLGQTAYRVNGEIRQMDTAPVAREGRTMLPVRYVAEPLGASVAWDGASQKVTVTLGDKVIELWVGKNTARVNGREVMIDPGNPGVMPLTVPPGRTMLPVRFISENLGCQVEWDDVTQEARLTYGQ
ncbi:MAG: stalk domain-containing protein [Bacillota bacterium]